MRKNKLMILVILILFVLSSLMTSCNQATQSSNSTDKVRIGFSLQDMGDPSWANMWTHMQNKADELGVEIVLSDAKSDPAKQIDSLENFIQGDVDALIVHCFSSDSATATLQNAKDKGIMIVAFDTYVDIADSYFGLDNYEMGKLIAFNASQFIKEKFPDGNVEVGVANYPLNQVCLDRAEGIVDGIHEYAPNAKIVAEAQAGYIDEGIVVGVNFMQAHPNMKVVVGIDDAGLVGIYESVVAAGKAADDFGMFGIDAIPEALNLISEDTIFRSTIHLDLNNIGERMVQTAYDLYQGKEVEEVVYFPVNTVDINNVKEYLQK